MTAQRLLKFAPALISGAWLLSLGFPAFQLSNGEVWYGYQVLFIGWLGVVTLTLGWYANPFVASIVFWWPRSTSQTRLSLSLLVVVLSVTTVFVDMMGGIPSDDARHPIQRFMAGYYVWQSCCIAPLVLWLWSLFRAKQLG